MPIDDVLLWMDVPEDDWRKVLVAAYDLDIPSGYWRRSQEGYPWFRQIFVRSEVMRRTWRGRTDHLLSCEDVESVIAVVNHWPPDRGRGRAWAWSGEAAGGNEAGTEALPIMAGSPEAIAAWSPENMRKYATEMQPREAEVSGSDRPPVLVGQVWAWSYESLSSLRTEISLVLRPEWHVPMHAILLYGPRAPWYGPWMRFTDAFTDALTTVVS